MNDDWQNNPKITAIKDLREQRAGMTLREAKDLVEKYILHRGQNWDSVVAAILADLPPVEETQWECPSCGARFPQLGAHRGTADRCSKCVEVDYLGAELSDLRTTLERQSAEMARMRAALAPFAAWSRLALDQAAARDAVLRDGDIVFRLDGCAIRVADLRRAVEATHEQR